MSSLDDMYYGVVLEVADSEIRVLNEEAGVGIGGNLLVDPQNIVCTSDSVLLGSVGYFYTASCWEFDENGQLNRKEITEYYLPGDFVLKTTTELVADEIKEEDGSILEAHIQLPVGTILKPLRTDDETFIDFTSKDGKIYRVGFEVKMDPDYGKIGVIEGRVASEYMNVVIDG